MNTRRKVKLILLTCLSLITATASILKAIATLDPKTPFKPVDGMLWAEIEQCLVIVMGSIPPLLALTSPKTSGSPFHKSKPRTRRTAREETTHNFQEDKMAPIDDLSGTEGRLPTSVTDSEGFDASSSDSPTTLAAATSSQSDVGILTGTR